MLQISTRLIAEAATRRGWRVEPLDDRFLSTLAITLPNKKTYYFDSVQPPLTSAAAMVIADNKLATYLIAQKHQIPVAEFIMHDPADLQASTQFLHEQTKSGFEVVVKPIDTNHGDGITIGVTSEVGLTEALAHAQVFSNKILLQRRHEGADCRVLVVDGHAVAAARREPAYVIGDGAHTIGELIEAKNRDPKRGEAHDAALSKIDIQAARRYLGKRYDDVPVAHEKVFVLATANLSKGGEAEDITDVLHQSFKNAAETMARTLDMFVCGVDFLVNDYEQPFTQKNGILLEINATPGIRMHQFPSMGQARDVAAIIVDRFAAKVLAVKA